MMMKFILLSLFGNLNNFIQLVYLCCLKITTTLEYFNFKMRLRSSRTVVVTKGQKKKRERKRMNLNSELVVSVPHIKWKPSK